MAPTYPIELAANPVAGTAVLQFVVGADGKVSEAELKSADHQAFGQAAMAALIQWEFEPATKDGKPVAKKVSLPFEFKPNVIDLLNKAFGRAVFTQFSEEPIPVRELGQRPQPVSRTPPSYPKSKRGSGEEQRVRMKFVIGKDGATYNPTVLDDVEKEWAMSAMAMVVGLKFEPIKRKGKLVLVEMMVPVLMTENPTQRRGPPGGGRGGAGGAGAGGND